MNLSENIRNSLNILEKDEYQGPYKNNPNVSYDTERKKGEITKVTANLKGNIGEKYIELGKKISRMKTLKKDITMLESEIKQEGRESIRDLFKAGDEIFTRVVETTNFTLQLNKTPGPTEVVKYAEVLKELESQLTPELIKVLENIKAKFTSIIQKEAALTYDIKNENFNLTESMWDRLKDFCTLYLSKIQNWGEKYDDKLQNLKNILEND